MKEYLNKYNKTGILLINLGSPDEPDAKHVKKYLKQFLSDKRVIEANRFIWSIILNGIILPIRSSKTAALYKTVWMQDINKSPLVHYTEQQSIKLNNQFDDNVFVDYAMRYGNPSIESKINHLQDNGVTNIIILPMYPQYSSTTIATVYDEIYRILLNKRWQPNILGIKPYYDNDQYITLLFNSIKNHLSKIDFKPDVILTSFHGIPQMYFDKGDPYYCHCHKTFRLLQEKVKQELDIDVRLCFQSRFGPKKWLQPYTSDVLEACVKENKKQVVVIAPGFPADCLETLEEIKEREKETFIEKGGEKFSFVPCLNADKDHVSFLKNLVEKHI
ncbi:ferrochelatase [Francisellaceae bacterium]|nr:ferrochelatase [Francisellaceae bacterium]